MELAGRPSRLARACGGGGVRRAGRRCIAAVHPGAAAAAGDPRPVGVDRRPHRPPGRWVGFWFGLGHHLVGFYWITDAILLEAARFWWLVPIGVPLLAAVLALFIAAPCALASRFAASWPRVLVLVGAWVLADLARQFTATGFPWNALGSVWGIPGPLGDIFLQPAAWIGLHGLTVLTLLLAATPALGRRAMAGGVVVLALWAGLGVWRLQTAVTAGP